MNVAVIGASNKPDRYSYKAVKLLLEKGHCVYPVHSRVKDIDGLPVHQTIRDITNEINTVTLYVGAASSTAMAADILACRPQRIIFNPGAENPILHEEAQKKGIDAVAGCTLVMLKTGQF